jgi:putative membrane protein
MPYVTSGRHREGILTVEVNNRPVFGGIRQWFDPEKVDSVGEAPDYRFSLANERTFLAWIRTALALIGGGLAASQLLQSRSRAVELIVSLVPICVGAWLAVMCHGRWRRNQQALRRGEPLTGDVPRLLPLVIVGMAIVIAVIVVADA